MSDPTRKDAGIHILGSAPAPDAGATADTSASAEQAGKPAEADSPRRRDEPWIRDVTVRNFAIRLKDEADAAALCGDDELWCEYCGDVFPLWPIRRWAAHIVHDHHDELTDQQIGGIAQFIQDGLSPLHAQWLGIQVMQRVSLRRRARDLNMIVSPIEKPLPGGAN